MYRVWTVQHWPIFKLKNSRLFSDQSSYTIRNQGSENIITIHLENGKEITLSSGKIARFASGTAICKMGNTSMMATAISKDSTKSTDFMPLTVDFRQKYAAAGRIPTNFFRKEVGTSDTEILTSRLIDRSIRPLFPTHFNCETQIVCNMLALDSINLPDVPSVNAASLALAVSDIPWNGPVGAVRLGYINDELVVNPSRFELQSSSLDMVLTASQHKLAVMIEGKADNIPYQNLLKAIGKGIKICRTIANAIEQFRTLYGKPKREVRIPEPFDAEILTAIRSMCEMRLNELFQNYEHDKISRDLAVKAIREDVVNRVWSSYSTIEPSIITEQFNKIVKEIFRELIFNDKRCDGRKLNEVRPLSCEVNLHEPLHGSALFQRGQTQVMTTVSLDSIDSAKKMDSLTSLYTGVKAKNFFLHYEFPPYATGEIGKVGYAGRREIGHGSLAEKGLLSIIPNDYPFTIRLTSEVLESNGSSSMATVCGGSLALMDAGVPISTHAAGVAMGLVTKYDENYSTKLDDYRILTDILGIEDYLGDMDMKTAWTRNGITAIQADIKTNGISLKVLSEALSQASQAKNHILSVMKSCISAPRIDKKSCWPMTKQLKIEPQHRSALLGPGGMNLKNIFLETGAHLTETEPCEFTIFAPSESAMQEVETYINGLISERDIPNLEFGGIYTANIVEMREHGVMVTLYKSMKPTLIHVAQLDSRRVASPTALGLQVGQQIKVKYFGTDPISGFMRLSRKMISDTAEGVVANYNK